MQVENTCGGLGTSEKTLVAIGGDKRIMYRNRKRAL